MESRIKARFNREILDKVMVRYGIGHGQVRLLNGFESFIYAFDKGKHDYILRVGHSFRRSENLIRGEVDWINYLASGGASVAKAIRSENDLLVEVVDDEQGGQFLATAFEKATGQPPGENEWNETLFQHYGRLIGRMHALSKRYQPPDPAWRRPEWDDPIMLYAESWLPESESIAMEKSRGVMASLKMLPKDPENYGLIHQDAHAGNFFVNNGHQITLFDFDDCAYSWYMNDIAIVLFYAVLGQDDILAFTENFLGHFFSGYRIENQLDPSWLMQIPTFLKLREIDLYAVIHRSFDIDNLDDPWVANFMANRKFRIDNDIPFVDFDFSQFDRLLAN